MVRRSLKKRKVLAAFMSVAFVSTAFTPPGCTFRVDEDTLQQLIGLMGSVQSEGEFGVNGSWASQPDGQEPGVEEREDEFASDRESDSAQD
jgi:hypothetical protein